MADLPQADNATDIQTLVDAIARTKAGDRSAARMAALQILVRRETDTALLERIAEVFEAAGRSDDAALFRLPSDETDDEALLQDGVSTLALTRRAEVEALFRARHLRYPERIENFIDYAWIAHYASDPTAALERWRMVAERFPEHISGPIGMSRALDQLGRTAEADTIITDMTARHPDDCDVLIAAAQIANARRDWQLAFARWEAVRALVPDHRLLAAGHGEALWGFQMDQADAAPDRRSQQIVDVGSVSDPVARDLFMQFESLGENCEFGLVQRRFEAEPLGLLRWTYISAAGLLRLLNNRFAKLGDSGATRMHLSHWNEWFVMDDTYDLTFHTFAQKGLANPDDILEKHSRRLRWLAQALITTLEFGQKMFVYKLFKPADEETLLAIAATIAAYGPGWLLVVALSDEDNPPGSARQVGERLIMGYLDRINPLSRAGSDVWDIPFDQWQSVCRQALTLRGALA